MTSKSTAKKEPSRAQARMRSNQWDANHGTYITGRAAIDGADALAIEMERRWGCGRLRLLVSTELREKFDRQRYLLNAAVCAGSLEEVRRQAQRMCIAWTALDREARESGCKPLEPVVWEVTLEDGAVAAIVRNHEDAKHLVADGRKVIVFSLQEIGRILSGYEQLVCVKLTIPGATVTAVRQNVDDPLAGVEASDFGTPFDDPVEIAR